MYAILYLYRVYNQLITSLFSVYSLIGYSCIKNVSYATSYKRIFLYIYMYQKNSML